MTQVDHMSARERNQARRAEARQQANLDRAKRKRNEGPRLGPSGNISDKYKGWTGRFRSAMEFAPPGFRNGSPNTVYYMPSVSVKKLTGIHGRTLKNLVSGAIKRSVKMKQRWLEYTDAEKNAKLDNLGTKLLAKASQDPGYYEKKVPGLLKYWRNRLGGGFRMPVPPRARRDVADEDVQMQRGNKRGLVEEE